MYHPQSKDLTKVVNRILQQYLRCFVMEKPKNWAKYLHLAELWYNTSLHSSTRVIPFEAMFERPPPPKIRDDSLDSSEAVQFYQDRVTILNKLKENLQRSKRHMKRKTDKLRREVNFKIDDPVFVKLHKYMQRSVANTKSNKMEMKYFGPYKIVEVIGKVAYRLELPENTKIHDLFHVSLLKAFVKGEDQDVSSTLPYDLV